MVSSGVRWLEATRGSLIGADIWGLPWVGCFRGRYLPRHRASLRSSTHPRRAQASLVPLSGRSSAGAQRAPSAHPCTPSPGNAYTDHDAVSPPGIYEWDPCSPFSPEPSGDPETCCFDQSHLKDGKTEAKPLALMFSVNPQLACGRLAGEWAFRHVGSWSRRVGWDQFMVPQKPRF